MIRAMHNKKIPADCAGKGTSKDPWVQIYCPSLFCYFCQLTFFNAKDTITAQIVNMELPLCL